MIDELRKNIDTEIEMLREIAEYSKRSDYADEYERKILENAIGSLTASMRIVNSSIPSLLNNISVATKLPAKTASHADLEKVSIRRAERNLCMRSC